MFRGRKGRVFRTVHRVPITRCVEPLVPSLVDSGRGTFSLSRKRAGLVLSHPFPLLSRFPPTGGVGTAYRKRSSACEPGHREVPTAAVILGPNNALLPRGLE